MVRKRKRTRVGRLRPSRRFGGGSFKMLPRRKRARTSGSYGGFAATGNELVRTKTAWGRYPKDTRKRRRRLLTLTTSQQVLRFQGVTNFDTNVGAFVLGNREVTSASPDSAWLSIPLHIYNLSEFAYKGTDGVVVPPRACKAFYWNGLSATQYPYHHYLTGQGPNGDTGTNTFTCTRKPISTLMPPRIMHDWLNIKLNLYGARKRGTTFYIEFVKFKEQNSNLWSAADTSYSRKDGLEYLTTSLTYSNLMSRCPEYRKYLDVVKRYKYYIPGGSKNDMDEIGKVREVKMFIRQGRVYDTQVHADTDLPHVDGDGVDYETTDTNYTHPVDRARLFMIIRAFAPERVKKTLTEWNSAPKPAFVPADGKQFLTAYADPLVEPSYDIVLENAYSFDN